MTDEKRGAHQPVTMEDVAQAAGVSRMTVSRALRSNGTVSEETRARILAIVEKMNYVPDQLAGSLTTRRSGVVATLVPSLNNLHFAESVQALSESLDVIGLQIMLGYTNYSTAREERLIESMLKRRPEAIVLPFDGHSERACRLLDRSGVPVIEQWEMPPQPIDYTVGFSNREAARDMTLGLIEKGYERIAFVSEAEDVWNRGAARRAGFEDAMEAAGLSAHRMVRFGKPPMSIEEGYQIGMAFEHHFTDADCVFCVSDAPAFGVLSAFLARGIRVPEDMAVVGFGNFEMSRFSSPALTTVEVDPRGIGLTTGSIIKSLLGEPEAKAVTDGASDVRTSHLKKHHLVKTRIAWRESTRTLI